MAYNDNAPDNYYSFVRKEIEPLLPRTASSILEVGAASGSTLKWLKARYAGAATTGVEINSELKNELSNNVDHPIIGSIEHAFDQLKSYDLILLLDVLEHLHDSLGALKRLSSLLNPGGSVIVSLPNISHLSVTVPLLLRREFEYKDAGILDRTHVRFFTETSAVQLLNDAGLTVKTGLLSGIQGPKSTLLNLASFGLLRHHLTKQYIMRAERSSDAHKQPEIHWALAK